MLKTPAKSEFPLGNVKSQAEWLNVIKTNGCYACHALGNKATRTIPPVFADMKSGGRLGAPHPVRPGDEQHGDRDRPHRHAACAQAVRRLDRPHRRGRTAGREAAAPAGPGAQRRHHAVGLLRSQALPARHHRDRQAQADAQRQRPDLRRDRELAPTSSRCSIRSSTRRPTFKMPVRDPKTPSSKDDPMSPSPYWGEEAIWDSQTSTHNPMYDEKGRVWFTSRVGAAANPDFCKKGSDHPSAKVFPLEASTRHLVDARSEDRQDHADPHLLPDAPSRVRRGRQQHAVDERGRAGQRRARLARPQDVRGDRRRGEVARLDADRHRHQRQRQARRMGRAEPAGRSGQGQAHRRRALRHRRQSAGRHDLGLGADLPGLHHPRRSGRQSVGDRARRNLRAADAGLRPARLRHRPQRHRLGAALERPHGQASTAASARCCTGPRPRPAGIARKAGRSIRSPARRCRASTETGSAEASYYTWVDQFDTFGLGRTCRGPPATPTSR